MKRKNVWEVWIPRLIVGFFAVYLLLLLRPPASNSSFDLKGFGCLPALNGGRIKPLDTIARTSLLMLSGRQSLRTDGTAKPAIAWLADVLFRPDRAGTYAVFEIDDPDVLGMMGIQQTKKRRYSLMDLYPYFSEIESQSARAAQMKPGQRTRYQQAVLALEERLALYLRLQTSVHSAGNGLAEIYPLSGAGRGAYTAMEDAYRAGDSGAFNKALRDYAASLEATAPREAARARFEFIFNTFEPFYQSMVIYVIALLLAFLSCLRWPKTLNRTALALLILGFVVHTGGLAARMFLQGRPPVTNLYSSAVFVGWGAVLLGIVLERFYRSGIGSVVASAIGFITLIVAHHLSAQGDTMGMMSAVLDSNFWLTTHVVCITIGYSSTFLSGFLATVYLLRRIFDKRWSRESAASLERMVFGIVCFSTFFSFVGTILGGIWADQSWGRFWGWDPKENGALLIVLWNVFILHARLGGQARQRMIMVMAVFGNIVTAFSWFGVNMLGVGLHSYGFMDKAFTWLMVFMASQLIVMGLAGYPERYFGRRD